MFNFLTTIRSTQYCITIFFSFWSCHVLSISHQMSLLVLCLFSFSFFFNLFYFYCREISNPIAINCKQYHYSFFLNFVNLNFSFDLVCSSFSKILSLYFIVHTFFISLYFILTNISTFLIFIVDFVIAICKHIQTITCCPLIPHAISFSYFMTFTHLFFAFSYYTH